MCRKAEAGPPFLYRREGGVWLSVFCVTSGESWLALCLCPVQSEVRAGHWAVVSLSVVSLSHLQTEDVSGGAEWEGRWCHD